MTVPHVDLTAVGLQIEAIEEADPATAPRRDEEGEPLWDPVVVFESISREDFRVWLKENEGDLRNWWYEPVTEDMGRVVVYSPPSFSYQFAVSEILSAVNRQLYRMGGIDMMDTIVKPLSPTCRLCDRDQEPSVTFSPREICLELTLPSVVVEIAYENATFAMMKEKLLRWMDVTTTVRVAIGIKLSATSLNHVAIRYIRDQETPRIVKFGLGVASPPPLSFPISELFHGATIPEQLAVHDDVSIDLLAFRDTINPVIQAEQAKQTAMRLASSAKSGLSEAKATKHRLEATPRDTGPNLKRQCRFHMKDPRTELARIQAASIADAPAKDEEGEPLWGPVVVFDSISRPAFREWLNNDKGWLRRWWYEPLALDQDSGRVVVYSLPNAAINATAYRILTNIIAEVTTTGDRHVSKSLRIEGEPICHLSDRDQQPLASLTPKQLHTTHHFPNLVVEVESRNVSLAMLKQKLLRWMGPESAVQVAIGVKLNENSGTHVAMRYLRGEKEPQIVFFGAGVEGGSPLTFPLQLLYYGATMPASLVGHGHDIITVDLDE